MHVYVASRLDNWPAVAEFQNQLTAAGHTITFDWTKIPADPKRGLLESSELDELALKEVLAVENCDVLIALLPGRIGTYVEIGIALAHNKPIILVGRRGDCPFFWLLNVLSFMTTDCVIHYLERGIDAIRSELKIPVVAVAPEKTPVVADQDKPVQQAVGRTAAAAFVGKVNPTKHREATGKAESDAVRQQREAVYGSPVHTLTRLSEHWTSLIRSRNPGLLIKDLDPSLVGLMLVCLKLHRAAVPNAKNDNDSYVDAHNYLTFAEEADTLLPAGSGVDGMSDVVLTE